MRPTVRPGTPVPRALTVVVMDSGAVFLTPLESRTTNAAYLNARDAAPLLRELALAFGTAPGGAVLRLVSGSESAGPITDTR